jgi:ribosomal protein S12 methylthiotransferase accessory factor
MSRFAQIFDCLVDDHVGIIRRVEEVPRPAGSPPLFYYFAKACDTSAFCQQKNSSNGGGASRNREAALAKSIGEAIERYCSAIFDREAFPLTSFDAAPFPCVPPGEFALYTPDQYSRQKFPFVPFDRSTLVRWAPCKDSKTSDQVYLPSVMIHLPYHFQSKKGELPIVQGISTGLACHGTYAEAAISAICEVIERDAFMITWQALLSPPQIRIESISELNQDLVARIQKPWCHVTLFNITLDLRIPTILSVVRNDLPDAPALIFAAASHPDPEKALQKSLEEVAFTGLLAQQLKRETPPISVENDYSSVVDQDCHVRLYGEHSNYHLAKFLFESEKRIEFSEIENLSTGKPKRDLEILIHHVHSVNHRVLIADITSPDVSALGLWVIRAVIPGFHPLFMGHHIRALGSSRLWEIPQKLGYKGLDKKGGDNPAPHPYP